jgi:DNA-binding NarL/FixJ family response regulator
MAELLTTNPLRVTMRQLPVYMMSTRLIIYAPSNLHRAAWQALLEKQPRISVAGQAGSPDELEHFRSGEGTAVLIDVPAPQPSLMAQLGTALPDSGLLVLVANYELAEIVALLQAGATGFIISDASVGDLARAIIATGRREVVLPPELATRALVALARGEGIRERPDILLTDREQEVLALLARGLTNKDIAQTLILSVRTVEAHLRNIYGKLQVNSRTEATLWAINHGIDTTPARDND